MVDGEPPMMDLDPIMVLRTIAMSTKRPNVNNPDELNQALSDFLDMCLAIDIQTRRTCTQLLSHRFMRLASNKYESSMIEAVKTTIEAKNQ